MRKQFLNSIYKSAVYERNQAGKRIMVSPDILYMIIKDIDTNEKELIIKERPKIKFYIAKEKQPYPKIFMPKSELEEVECFYEERDIEIAKKLNMVDEFWNSLRNKTHSAFMREMLSHPDIYMGDINIEDYYKIMFTIEHGEHPARYKKGFSDIEVDISNYNGFPYEEEAPCPINTINYIDGWTKTVYSVILRNHNNPQIKELEEAVESGDFQKELLESFTKQDQDFKFLFYFVDSEQEVINQYFRIIEMTEPDFVAFWNIHFDIETIINRMKRLKMDIAEIMCPTYLPKKYKYVKWNEDNSFGFGGDDDKKNAGHPSRLWHWLEVAGKTQWYDQMALYSNLRKRMTLPSYTLDDIGESEVGIRKIKFGDFGESMKSVISSNFRLFMKYAIRDVYVQYKIEEKVNDVERMVNGTTRLSKITKISYIIKNMLTESFYRQGNIIGNTVAYNVFDTIPGAIVSDPNLIEQRGIKIGDFETNLYKFVVDFDAASLYPNLMIAFNIAKSTLFGRIYKITRIEPDGLEIPVKMTGGEFNNSLQTIDSSIFDLCSQLFGLPTFESIVDDIEYSITKNKK